MLSGTKDWTHFVYKFEVQDAADIELVCEMRAKSGKVSFDTSSLKLIKE